MAHWFFGFPYIREFHSCASCHRHRHVFDQGYQRGESIKIVERDRSTLREVRETHLIPCFHRGFHLRQPDSPEG